MSYMDRDNIINEGILDKLKNLFKDKKKYNRVAKVLMKDPEYKKKHKELQKNLDDYEKSVDKLMKKYNLK